MAAMILPDAPFSVNSFAALAPRRSTETISPPHRPDTPQLTLHDYRAFQESPLLPISPNIGSKRVRRVTAASDLIKESRVQTRLARRKTSGSNVQNGSIHSFGSRTLLPCTLPSPSPSQPHTPQERRPATASPSLSSTIDTLQSTPAHSLVSQAGLNSSLQDLRRCRQITDEALRDCKLSDLRPAKRLPRPVNAGGNGSASSSSSNIGAIYSVYATVFDPAKDESFADDVISSQQGYQQAPLPSFNATASRDSTLDQIKLLSRQRLVDLSDFPDSTAATSLQREAPQAADSTLSLSRLQFPIPPSHDNWGPIDHIARPPSSPATVHLYGASFDLVNPHASLLLGTHDLETPAEIDGLLDDYFQLGSEERISMASHQLRNAISNHSLDTANDGARHARILYDSPNSARRNILRVDEDIHTPPRVFDNSPLSKSSSTLHIPSALISPPNSPSPTQMKAVPSVSNVINSVKDEVERFESLGQGKIASQAVRPASRNTSQSSLVSKASKIKRSLSRASQRSRYRSDPFDLTLSDSGEENPMPPLANIAKHRIEYETNTEAQDGNAPNHPSEQGNTTHANFDDQKTDTVVREILDGYNYTRESTAAGECNIFADSPSLEKGRIFEDVEQEPSYSLRGRPIPPDPFADDTFPSEDKVTTLVLNAPTPSGLVHGGSSGPYEGASTELPTSERTYGETNQLLLVTPEATDASHMITVGGATNPDRSADISSARNNSLRYYRQEVVVLSPRSPSVERARGYLNDTACTSVGAELAARDGGSHESSLDWPRQFRKQLRTSSIFGEDNESAWETQYTTSYVDLPHTRGRSSEDAPSFTRTSNPGKRRVDGDLESVYPLPAQLEEDEILPCQDSEFDPELARTAAKRMTMLLEDKIFNEEIMHRLCAGPAPDKEQREQDHAELERLRREYPSRFSLIAEEHRRKVKQRISLIKSESVQKLQDVFGKDKGKGKSKTTYDPEQSFNKAAAFGRIIRPREAYQGTDHRRLLGPTPSPVPSPALPDGTLQWSESLGTMVTARNETPSVMHEHMHGTTPEFWSPFTSNPTFHVLESQNTDSPYHPAKNGITGSATHHVRSTRAAISGQKGLHSLKLKPSQPTRGSRLNAPPNDGPPESYEMQVLELPRPPQTRQISSAVRGLSDEELVERSLTWQARPDLSAAGALGRYATQPEVRCRGPVLPRLGPLARDDGHLDLNDPLRDNGRNARLLVAKLCVLLPVPVGVLVLCGGGGWILRKKTNGLVREMDRKGYFCSLGFTFVGFVWWTVMICLLAYFAPREGE